MTVDRQRTRVYHAEQRVADQLDFAARGARTATVHGSTVTVDPDVRFGSLDTAQAWLVDVRGRSWFRARWPRAAAGALTLRPRRGQRGAHYEPAGVIAVPVPAGATGWAMRELVLVHELAHHVVAGDVDAAPEPAAHGGEFAAVMLTLVEGTLGAAARLLLAAAYHDAGVVVDHAAVAPRTPEGDRG